MNTGTGNNASQISSLWNAKVPYTGATADVLMPGYGLSAQALCTSISAIYGHPAGVQGFLIWPTISTARSIVLPNASGTALLNNQLLAIGRVSAVNVGNGKIIYVDAGVPYTGATANVDLASFSITAAAVSTNYINGISATKSITVERIGDAEKIPMFWTDDGISAAKFASVCIGTSPSVTWAIYWGTDINGTGTLVHGDTTTSTTDPVLTAAGDFTGAAAITANSFVWLTTSATAGTSVDYFHLTMEYVK